MSDQILEDFIILLEKEYEDIKMFYEDQELEDGLILSLTLDRVLKGCCEVSTSPVGLMKMLRGTK